VEDIHIQKLVHGGQGLGTLADGRKAFVWNALPNELVRARIIKKKSSYVEAIAEEILKPSTERVEPKEENYLSTSPWQVLNYESENKYKGEIVRELFEHEKVVLPVQGSVMYEERQWNYRNKMEYSFWGDDQGLHLALHRRGSHGKQIVDGSKLALPAVDMAANEILAELQKLDVRAGDLKTVVIRASQAGEVAASLFVKPVRFSELTLPKALKGLRVYHSNPKSPASVPTKLLYELGDVTLTDTLLGRAFVYDVDSFFQVNIPIFERALQHIADEITEPSITDMYAGVGSIGLSVAREQVDLVEIDSATAAMACRNAESSGIGASVIEASTENSLEYILADKPVVFDPPRAGMHARVIERVLEVLPNKIIYLSCNPATHARDLAKLQDEYQIKKFQVFNFFPRTPHIETLAVLEKR
jgi:23S rRNA (uracil1939-C5)-methyltransferase